MESTDRQAGMSSSYLLGGLALGMVVGAISGLVGIGGGALLIPALLFFYGMSQRKAQGTSLATLLLPVGIFAFWKYYRAGHADLRLAVLIVIGFAIGGWMGGAWAQHLPEAVLRKGFATLLIVVAVKLAIGR